MTRSELKIKNMTNKIANDVKSFNQSKQIARRIKDIKNKL